METQTLPVPAEAGDVLFFDGHLFHGAGENSSSHTRASLTLGFHAVDQLSKEHHSDEVIIVRGVNIYRGNDSK